MIEENKSKYYSLSLKKKNVSLTKIKSLSHWWITETHLDI